MAWLYNSRRPLYRITQAFVDSNSYSMTFRLIRWTVNYLGTGSIATSDWAYLPFVSFPYCCCVFFVFFYCSPLYYCLFSVSMFVILTTNKDNRNTLGLFYNYFPKTWITVYRLELNLSTRKHFVFWVIKTENESTWKVCIHLAFS